MSTSISSHALHFLFPNNPIRKKAFTLLFLLLTWPRDLSQWTTCRSFHPWSGEMIVFLWLWITFPRWWLWPPARRTSQQRPVPSSSLNKCGYTLGSHKPLSQIGIVDSSTHFGWASGHYWTPSSPNPLPSTLRQMAKPSSSTEWLCMFYACTIPSTSTHGMRFFLMFSIVTIEPYIFQPTTCPFRWGWDFNHWIPWMLHNPLCPHRKNHPMHIQNPTKPPGSLN